MRREDLEIGGMYVGPEAECYEIRDTTPGWKINATGEWVPDHTTRTRYSRNTRTQYKTNLLVKAVIHRGDLQVRAVVDPRNLRGPWDSYVNEREVAGRHHQRTRVAVKSLMAVLSTHPGYGMRPPSDYLVSKSGASMTLPTDDVLLLLELAQPHLRPRTTAVPQVNWLSP